GNSDWRSTATGARDMRFHPAWGESRAPNIPAGDVTEAAAVSASPSAELRFERACASPCCYIPLRFLFALRRHFIEIADLAGQLRDPAGERLNGGDRTGRGKLDRAKPRRDRNHLQAPSLDLVPIAARRQQRKPEPGSCERGGDPETLARVDAPAMGAAGAKPLLDRTMVIGLAGQCDHRPVLQITGLQPAFGQAERGARHPGELDGAERHLVE